MTDTAMTTKQQQTTWIVENDAMIWGPNTKFRLVNVPVAGDGSFTSANVKDALKDPANVLNVDAYPAVVEALIEMVQYEELRCGKKGQVTPLPRCVHNAQNRLAAVHPHGDKG